MMYSYSVCVSAMHIWLAENKGDEMTNSKTTKTTMMTKTMDIGMALITDIVGLMKYVFSPCHSCPAAEIRCTYYTAGTLNVFVDGYIIYDFAMFDVCSAFLCLTAHARLIGLAHWDQTHSHIYCYNNVRVFAANCVTSPWHTVFSPKAFAHSLTLTRTSWHSRSALS